MDHWAEVELWAKTFWISQMTHHPRKVVSMFYTNPFPHLGESLIAVNIEFHNIKIGPTYDLELIKYVRDVSIREYHCDKPPPFVCKSLWGKKLQNLYRWTAGPTMRPSMYTLNWEYTTNLLSIIVINYQSLCQFCVLRSFITWPTRSTLDIWPNVFEHPNGPPSMEHFIQV